MESLWEYECPHCIDEGLFRVIGNLLLCGGCQTVFIEKSNVNNPVGRMEVIDDSGDWFW